MPLNSVQLFVKDQLDGLQFPITQQGNLVAYIAPPNPDNFDQPLVHIWGATTGEKRTTTGHKEIQYDIDLWVYFAEELDDPLADSLFPVILDTITDKMRNITMPVAVVDVDTGTESRIVAIGEDMKTDYAPARTMGSEQFVVYMARMIITVREWLVNVRH